MTALPLSRDFPLRPIPEVVSIVPAIPLAWAVEAEVEPEDEGVVDVPSISPELVLVDPDLREVALALLADRPQDGWMPPPYVPPSPAALPAARTASHTETLAAALDPDADPQRPQVFYAVVAYTLASFANAALLGGVIVAILTGLGVLAEVLHP